MDFLAFEPTDPNLSKAFCSNGFVLVRNLIPKKLTASFADELVQLCRARLHSLGITRGAHTHDLDIIFDNLCEIDRAHGSDIFDIGRTLNSFYSLVRCEKIFDILDALMPNALIQMPFAAATLHVTRPNEDRFLFDWHQDYTYNLMGMDAVTVWLTITDLTQEMGPLVVVPASHDSIGRLHSIDNSFNTGSGGGGKLFDYDQLDVEGLESKAIEITPNAGDCLFFHPLLWHRSGRNRSKRTRWVINPRYGNLLNESIVRRGYRCGPGPATGLRQIFGEVHPDLIA